MMTCGIGWKRKYEIVIYFILSLLPNGKKNKDDTGDTDEQR